MNTTAANKQLIARFYEEVWNRGNLQFAHEVFAPEYERHDLRPGAAVAGPEGQAKIAGDFRAAFPDLELTIDLLVGEDDLVVARTTATGTNTGGWAGRPATGRRARFSVVNIFRLRDGKVVEIWNHRDDLGLMQQLGSEIYAGADPRSAIPKGD